MSIARVAVVMVLCLSAAALATPKLSVSEAVWDFGVVESGTALTHTFVLGNSGDEPLVISKVTTSCGCTTAPLATPYTLNPSETVDLAVTLHVSAVGTVARTVTVASNDSSSPLYLTVKATVPQKAVPAISPVDLAADYYLLLDLRTQAEYAGGHILGAMSFPYADLASWAVTLPTDVLVIVYDLDGSVSPAAVQALRNAGVPQSFSLSGGYALWAATYPALTTQTGAASEAFLASRTAATASSPEMVAVNAEDLHSIFTVLVDVRDAQAFAAGHLAGAADVPASSLANWASTLPRDVDLVLYGAADEGLAAAASVSTALGMTKVTALAGGLSGWQAAYGDLLLVGAP